MKRKDPEHAELPEEDRVYERRGELGLGLATYGEDDDPPCGVTEVSLGESPATDVRAVVVDVEENAAPKQEPPKSK